MTIGIWQIALIVVIILLLFGAGKLPRLMGDFAKGVKAFKGGLKDAPENAAAPPKTGEQKTAANSNDADPSKKKETAQR